MSEPRRKNVSPKHKIKRGVILLRRVRNRCWSCDMGGSVNNYRLVADNKDSVRPVHLNEKCMEAAREKYKAYAMTLSAKA